MAYQYSASERAPAERRSRGHQLRVVLLRVLPQHHRKVFEVLLQELRQMSEAGLFLCQDLRSHNESPPFTHNRFLETRGAHLRDLCQPILVHDRPLHAARPPVPLARRRHLVPAEL